MSTRVVAAITVAAIVVVLGCGGLLGAVFNGGAAGCAGLPGIAASLPAGQPSPPPGGYPAVGSWNSAAVGNAAIIVGVGARLGVPARGWVIAVATAIQESSLINLPDLGDANNADSLGLFQQRPSQGWGTPAQIMDPVYASTKFYEHLQAVPGWQAMSLADAAQAVQHSGLPQAYGRWENDATHIVAAVGSSGNRAMSVDLEQCPSNCPPILSRHGGALSTSAGTGSSVSGGCGAGGLVVARGATWLTAWSGGPVPYLSSGDSGTWFRGYRRDCSGFASMALGLPGPGLDTAALAARSTPIPRESLRAGDLLINPAGASAGHVVIFEVWADATKSTYLGYEQSADGGTHHRLIPYPYFGGYPMSPYRYSN